MKNLSVYSIVLYLVLIVLFFPGCEKESVSTADIGYEGFKSDVELFYEFAYRKESLILNTLNYTSDGFTKAPFEGTVSRDEFGKFFLELEDMNKNSEKYLQAIQKLEQSGVLQRPTQTRGLFSSAKDFITWMSGSGKRNRERITTIASNMSSQERSKLYNGLRKEWKDKASGEADFWNKLQKGDYDSSAGQIYNDFYHDAHTEFPDLAQEKGLTPQKIVVNEGAKGIETGANVALDGAATLIPGFGTGTTLIKVSDNVEKMTKSETWKEAAEHGFHAATDMLEELGGDYGYTAFNAGDVVIAIKNKVDDLVFKKDDKHETNGKVTVKDKNAETPASIIIAQKKGGGDSSDGTPSIYVTGKEYVSGGIDMVVKAGTWLVTAVSEGGFRITVEMKVEAGKVTVTEVNTREPEEETSPNGTINAKLLTYVTECYIEITGTHRYALEGQDYTASVATWSEFYGSTCGAYPKGNYQNKVFSATYNQSCQDDFYGTLILLGSISLTFDETKKVIKSGQCQLVKKTDDSEGESETVCNFNLRDMPFTVTKEKIEISYSGEIGKEIYGVNHRISFSQPYGSGVDHFTKIKKVYLRIELKEKLE